MSLSAAGVTDAATWRERDARVISPAYHRYSDLVVETAEGAHLHTIDGRDVLDLTCGIGVTNLGHGHPAVVAAVQEQAGRLIHTSVTTLHTRQVEAAEALARVSPPGLDAVFLTNSGAEAVEGAIKLARRATGRSEIIAFNGAFHGRTYGALSLTASKAQYRNGVGPFLPGIHHVDYPYCFRRCPPGPDGDCHVARGDQIERLFQIRVPADSVAAIIVEPVMGEGGYVVPPREFLPALRRICDEHGILLIADEVQSGFGRTGRMFAVEHFGVVPDIMCVAKGFGNGMPIAGVVARHEVMNAWHPGDHGTTYGGNPVACAAAVAVIETLQREGLPQRAEMLGSQVMERVEGWRQRFPSIGDVRGLGLMIGVEFMHDGVPAREVVNATTAAALERDLLLLTCGTDENVIRLVPPLTIPEADLDRALEILESALADAGA